MQRTALPTRLMRKALGVGRITPCAPVNSRSDPGVMKQILLRISAVFAEITLGELAQPLLGHPLSPRKIMLPQHTLDPDIDRECLQPLIGKKHYAIGNLRPHAWQCAQLFSELGIR